MRGQVCEEREPYARNLRRSQTNAERKLWSLLRDRRLAGFKFRRQHPVGPFIVDFCCTEVKVIVELDGGHHALTHDSDMARSGYLAGQGYRVLRFWNNEVLGNTSGVLERIVEALTLNRRSPLTLPSPQRGEGIGIVMNTAERRVYTVSELTASIKTTLEEGFPMMWVEGEISNLRTPGSGHAYFTLKDEGAQISAVLFRGRGRRVRFELEDGMQVLAFGGLDVYAARGQYQLVVEMMEPKGLGALQLAFEQLKRKLEAEGLFEEARKRPLPAFPRVIGIVTSPTGAAIRDMLNIIGRRFADLHILITPVRVQGDEAPGEIVQALVHLQEIANLDVIIVGRGGGSIEDLWAFNDERVARALAACRVPVISAVGHETDFTIADFVADLRAPTPSGAAELVVREKLAVMETLADLYARLKQAMTAEVSARRERVDFLLRRRVLTDPARALRDVYRRLDDLQGRLRLGLRASQRHITHRVALATGALRSRSPLSRIAAASALLSQLRVRLASSAAHNAKTSRARFAEAVGRLESLSPLGVLARSYSVTRLPSGEVVRSATQVGVGDALEILLHHGALGARVTEVRERDERHQV